MSMTHVGLLLGMPSLLNIIFSPPFGRLVSRIGGKFMFVSGVFAYAVSVLLFGLLEHSPPGMAFVVTCYATRAVQGIGGAAIMTTSYTIIASRFPNRVTTYFSFLETFSGVGFMAGPPLGGFLYQFGGFGLPFYIVGACFVVILAVSYFCLDSMHSILSANQPRKSVCSFITKPGTAVVGYSLFIYCFASAFLQPTLALFLVDFHLESYQVGLVFVVSPAVYCIAGPLSGYISDRKGYLMTQMLVGSVFACIGYLLLGPAPFLQLHPTIWLAIMAIVIHSLSGAILYVPSFPALISLALEAGYPDNFDTYGMISGLFLGFYCFGTFMGSSVGGMMAVAVGFQWATFITSTFYMLSIVSLGMFALFKKNKNGGQIFGTLHESTQNTQYVESVRV